MKLERGGKTTGTETWNSMESVFTKVMPHYATQDRGQVDRMPDELAQIDRFIRQEAARLFRRISNHPIHGNDEVAAQEWHRILWDGGAALWDQGREFARWGFTILKHTCFRVAAGPGETALAYAADLFVGEGSDVLESVAESDEIDRAVSKMKELPEYERDMILARFFCQLSGVEIAARLGCSESKVSRDTRRIIDRLRDDLN